MTAEQPAGTPEVDARGSQGVLIGSGNQYNTWLSRPPDVAALTALNARAAGAYLARLSRDDAAMLLASAAAEVSARVITALLDSDESLVIALVGHLNQDTAGAVIAGMPESAGWLADVPGASEAMDRCAARAGAALGAATGPLTRLDLSRPGAQGFAREHENGIVYWASPLFCTAVSGPVAAYYRGHGATAGALGFPAGHAVPFTSEQGTEGICQAFSGGLVLASALGTFAVRLRAGMGFGDYFLGFGFPVAEQAGVGCSRPAAATRAGTSASRAASSSARPATRWQHPCRAIWPPITMTMAAPRAGSGSRSRR